MLPVYWKQNRRTWVTQEIFLDWYTNYFCSSVLCFCQEKELPAHALLLLDSAPGHFANLAEVRSPLDINIVYMPPNTTSHLQPVDEKVIATFKAYYLCHTFIKWWEFWTGHTIQTRITGSHSTFWRALITSIQLQKNCQWTVWMECGGISPRIYAQLHRIWTRGEHCWKRLAGWHKKTDWTNYTWRCNRDGG